MIVATLFGGPRDGEELAVNDKPDTLGRLDPIVLPEFRGDIWAGSVTVTKRYYAPDLDTLKVCPCCPAGDTRHWSCIYRYVSVA